LPWLLQISAKYVNLLNLITQKMSQSGDDSIFATGSHVNYKSNIKEDQELYHYTLPVMARFVMKKIIRDLFPVLGVRMATNSERLLMTIATNSIIKNAIYKQEITNIVAQAGA